jgi:hypothetical protein
MTLSEIVQNFAGTDAAVAAVNKRLSDVEAALNAYNKTCRTLFEQHLQGQAAEAGQVELAKQEQFAKETVLGTGQNFNTKMANYNQAGQDLEKNLATKMWPS